MKRKKRKQKTIIFILNEEIYKFSIIVACGATQKEIVSYLKHNKVKKDAVEWIEKDKGMFELKEQNLGIACFDSKSHANIILLNVYEDTWTYWETLLHELHHIVYWMSGYRSIQEEKEAQAYLMEYLFREIRRKIQGL